MAKKKLSINFPQYVSLNSKTVEVVGLMKKDGTADDYVTGKGYVDESDGSIWIYASKKPIMKNAYPFFWFTKEKEEKRSDPADLVRQAFNLDKMVDMSVLTIVQETEPNEVLYDEEEIIDMNAAAALYVPEIRESDDFLKKIIKTLIIVTGTDVSTLKSKTEEKYMIPNMRQALDGNTKMSTTYFLKWCELLGFGFKLTLEDNGEKKRSPLKNPIAYLSYRDKMFELKDGEEKEIDIPTIEDKLKG